MLPSVPPRAVRLRHDLKAHIRAIQISKNALFAYCEGRCQDPFTYSELLKRAQSDSAVSFQMHQIEEVMATGGKGALLDLYSALKRKKLLRSQFKEKHFCCIFFIDKDIDDVKKTQIRSPYLFYTEMYDLEAHLFRDSDLVRAVATALGLDTSVVPAPYSQPAGWIEAKAAAWEAWLELCLYSELYHVSCGCSFGRISAIHESVTGAMGQSKYDSFHSELRGKSQVDDVEFESRFQKVRLVIASLKAASKLSSMFSGKWLSAIIETELKETFRRKLVSTNYLGRTVLTAAACHFNFEANWAKRHTERLSALIRQIV